MILDSNLTRDCLSFFNFSASGKDKFPLRVFVCDDGESSDQVVVTLAWADDSGGKDYVFFLDFY